MDSPQDKPRAPLVMVVRRGDDERYRLLKTLFNGDRVQVMLDRREGERRAPDTGAVIGADRRNGNRRTPYPDTWVNLGFFVARRH